MKSIVVALSLLQMRFRSPDPMTTAGLVSSAVVASVSLQELAV